MLVFLVIDQRFRLGQPLTRRVNPRYRLSNCRTGTFTLDAFAHTEVLVLVSEVLVERRVFFERRNFPQRLEDLFSPFSPRAGAEKIQALRRHFHFFPTPPHRSHYLPPVLLPEP